MEEISLKTLNTLKVLSAANASVAGASAIPTTIRSNIHHGRLKKARRYAKSFNSISIMNMHNITKSMDLSIVPWVSIIDEYVSRPRTTALIIISAMIEFLNLLDCTSDNIIFCIVNRNLLNERKNIIKLEICKKIMKLLNSFNEAGSKIGG